MNLENHYNTPVKVLLGCGHRKAWGLQREVFLLDTRYQNEKNIPVWRLRNFFFVMNGFSCLSDKESVHEALSLTRTCLLKPFPVPLCLFLFTISFRSSDDKFSHSSVRSAFWYHFLKARRALWHGLQRTVEHVAPPHLMESLNRTMSSQSTHLMNLCEKLTQYVPKVRIWLPSFSSQVETQFYQCSLETQLLCSHPL